MGLFEEISRETKKRRKKYPKKYLGFKRYEYFEIRPLFDLKNNLLYQHANLLFEEDFCYVMAKKRKEVIYKYIIINDLDKYKALNLTDELLVSYNLGRKFEYGFKIEELGKLKTVEVYILAAMDERTIKYSILNTSAEKELYKMGLCYDEENTILVQFMMNKEYGGLSKEFKVAVYHDIGAKDVEDV